MLPELYQTHLQNQLELAQYLMLKILFTLLQSSKQVNLEKLATALPQPIKFASRRRKLQRFLSLPHLTIKNIWFPIIANWLNATFNQEKVVHIVIDRTQWGTINLLMISLVWERRSIPLYWELLGNLGSSNLEAQTNTIAQALPLLKEYKVIILGDREFCSVELGSWLRQKGVYFCLRLKRSEFIQIEGEIWVQLNTLGLSPGVSLYFSGVKVTKKKKVAGFNVACKWQRKYRGLLSDEGWFILTNLASLEVAITAYKKRFGIEEMFRDFKKGGYNLEGTGVSGDRLIALVLLIAIAYSSATMQGKVIKQIGVQNYVGRLQEPGRTQQRHSSFYVGLYGQTWVNSMELCATEMAELMRLNPNKRKYYQQGLRAVKLIKSVS